MSSTAPQYNVGHHKKIRMQVHIRTSRDDVVTVVSRKATVLSKHLKEMLNDHAGEELLVHEMTSVMFGKIVEYLEHYRGCSEFSRIMRPLPSADLGKAGCNAFDVDFVKGLSKEEAKDLMLAGNYLDIPSLVELAAARIASIIKGTSLKDLMNDAGITEFTPEWREAVRKANPWCKAIQKSHT